MSRKNRDPGRKEAHKTEAKRYGTETKPYGRITQKLEQVYLSLLSIAMINHSDQKQSGKEKAYLADTF